MRCLLIFSLSFAASGVAQDVAPLTVDQVVARLAVAGTFEDAFVSDEPSRVYPLYVRLAALASTERLVALCGHPAPVLRCYATRALVENDAAAALPTVVRAHLADTTPVEVHSGCERLSQAAGDLIFELARQKLTQADLLDLGEDLVRSGSKLYARQWALRELRFRDGMLHEIRALAQNGDAPALIALARYGIDKDAAVLIEHLGRPEPFDDNCAFLAAEILRVPSLLPALVALEGAARARLQRDNASRLRFWLRAIAAQRSVAAAEFLARFLASEPTAVPFKRRELRTSLREAIAAHEDPVFGTLSTALGRE